MKKTVLERFLYGNKKYNNISMGLSFAAAWAWGVSIIVGMQVATEKGTIAFIIWAFANSIALAIFGIIALKAENNAAEVTKILDTKTYKILMAIIQFFSVLVNITAIKTAMDMLGAPSWGWLGLSALLFVLIFWRGYDASIKTDIVQIIFWVCILLGALIILPKQDVALPISQGKDVLWAVYGGLMLIGGPLVDKQMWQRKTAMRDKTLTPYIWGSVIFAGYMSLVYLLAKFGINSNTVIGLVILLVAGSTLQSALSAISCYGKTLKQSRGIMLMFFALASICLTFNLPVISLWTVYGSIRIPFAIYIIWRVIKHG